MVYPKQPALVSAHGGHSGEFCGHAKNTLEEIIRAYIDKGFSWIGITEHMPPVSDRFLYPADKAAGLDAWQTYKRFSRYISTCRRLQKKYQSNIKVYVGFESETYSGSEAFIRQLISEFQPDYIVGALHHVSDMQFDFSAEQYNWVAEKLGGTDELYCQYFDQQYEMINSLKPRLIGHFDLVRIFDPDYRTRLKKPSIQRRIQRNLKQIRELDLILDFNVRAYAKGADEPYVARSILIQALDLGILVLPGDDSHSVNGVGLHLEKGIGILREIGFDTNWHLPTD